MLYRDLEVDCVLLSSFPIDAVFRDKARAHAAIHNYWVGLSVPKQSERLFPSTLIGPDGHEVRSVTATDDVIVGVMDRDDPALDIALNRARPWRTTAATGEFYRPWLVDDPRSADTTSL